MDRTAAVKSAPVSARSAEVSNVGLRILVLDNEPEILVAMQLLLSRLGHKVDVYQTADEAVLGFTKQKFDVALIDYRLEGAANGIEVVRQLRRLDSRTRFYLVTGDSAIRDNPTNISVIYKPLTAAKLAPLL